MIIDIHVHTSSPDARYDPGEVADASRLARRSGIDRIVHLFNLGAGGYDPSPADVQTSNDLSLQLVERHPDLYLGFCYLNPVHARAFLLEEIERCIVQGTLCGIKLWVAVRAHDARLDPILERAAVLNVPVLQHAWYKRVGQLDGESTPADVADLARRHPRATIIMAHLGGGGWRGVLDVKACPNVYVDTSGAQPQAGLVEYAVQELGADRVLFGSDWPIRDFAVQKARVTGARLSDEDKRRILGGNAMGLLRLAPAAAEAAHA